MGWEVVKAPLHGARAKSFVTVSYRKNGTGNFAIFVSIPLAVTEKLGWQSRQQLLFAYGTGSESGLGRLTRTDKEGYAIAPPHKESVKMLVRIPSWVKLPKETIRATPVRYDLLEHPQPTLQIHLPDWLIKETGDLGPRKKLFK